MQGKNLFSLTFRSLLFIIFILITTSAVATEDADSLAKESRKRANKIALKSSILPGLGQISNHKYWKVPVLYAGFGALVYFIDFNNKNYKDYKQAFLYRNDGDPLTIDAFPSFTNDDIKVRKDYYRRNRDLSYILTVVLYSLNIVDAYVDAQLINFDVSEDLSLNTLPYFDKSFNGEPVTGLRFTFTLK